MCDSGACQLEHENPGKFDRSQWCNPERVSTWYCLYRIFVALFFVAGIFAKLYTSHFGVKWLIYMTDQGIAFLAIHFIVEACIVTVRWTWERLNPGKSYHDKKSLSFMYRISWFLSNCFFSIALFISIIYWAILHKFVVEAHLLENETEVILNVFLHASNTVACLIDIFISARPWKVGHFVYAITFGFYYTGFSVIYWGAGGVGLCYDSKDSADCENTTSVIHLTNSNGAPWSCCPYDGEYCTVPKGDQWCDPFIYPILDWQNNALIAVGVILGGSFIVPFIHFIWMGLAWLRKSISKKNGTGTKSLLPKSIETSRSTSNTTMVSNVAQPAKYQIPDAYKGNNPKARR